MSSYVSGAVVRGGMGGFLCPPNHPMHNYSVETDLNRRKDNRGSMSLDHAAKCEYLDPEARQKARNILESWEPLPIDSPEVQDWIYQVLGYFRNCYCRGDGSNPEDWYAENITITKNGLPDNHAGVHLIRKYYPDFVPSQNDWDNAYWGQKPE